MNKNTLSNLDKIAIVLLVFGTVMIISGSFTERTETQIAGIMMWLGGGLQMMNSRIHRLEKRAHHDS